MFKWWRRKKTEQKIVNLETASAFDDEIEGFSGANFSDETIDFKLSQSKRVIVNNLENSEIKTTQEDTNSIHSLVQNSRHQINKYKEEHNVNEHENLLERLEQLKKLRDSSQVKPNEFQQMLNRIKERNFNDRMAYIMDRIKISHRDDDKLELAHNGEPLAENSSKRVKKNKITIAGDKSEINTLKQNLPKKTSNNLSEKENATITLSVKQFQQVVRDTVEGVLVELGIKNKDE
ncbi:hypothetical protein M1771_05270 [Spiroplasma citri]|uniref:Uncharacterized protein n=1 Tax=Spiroplasma citri TaxID=2133 RepID=A0AAX3SW06_SPICI|nr:hypothetical protein [Spiroplasma citri]WFG95514.1 hypothetical protein M0C40_05305 [Spiroplasma citri]WFG99402.1 hypothetical protein M1771_05270 [Spiroplasma citri]